MPPWTRAPPRARLISASRGYLRIKSQAASLVCTHRLIFVQEEVRLDANGLCAPGDRQEVADE